MMNESYIYTDLACELSDVSKYYDKNDVEYSESTIFGYNVLKMDVKNENGQMHTNKPIGKYRTVYFDSISECSFNDEDKLSYIFSELIDELIPNNTKSIFVGGIGNINLSSDSIGPKVTKKLTPTRHIKEHDKDLFFSFSSISLSTLSPGVLSMTGIESAEIFCAIVKKISPDVVILIDSLCARDTARLCKTLQICDTGITPGSGVNNSRGDISQKTLGCPVIAIGVPTVVSSQTLIYDAIQKADLCADDTKLETVLQNNRSFFVTISEIEALTDKISDIIANSINAICDRSLENK